MANRTEEQRERLKEMIGMAIDADVLEDTEVSEILGICIDACKRAEIDDTERIMMERLKRDR